MRLSFSLVMAWRESRRSRRRLALYMSAVSLGVAALVAINSFSANVSDSVRGQAKTLLGADIEIGSRAAFPDTVRRLLDSAANAGNPISHVTSFASMVLSPRTGLTRLFEVRAVTGGFPYYGAIETDPPGQWSRLGDSRIVLVDPAVLVQLDAKVGDTLSIGEAAFQVAGVVTSSPGDVGLRTAIGPRAFIAGRYLGETNLLRFGSRAQYRAYIQMADAEVEPFLNRSNRTFQRNRIWYDTAAEQEENIGEALGRLARYLGLVGLIALLLGGIGVGSAVHVFVKEKLDTAALLRCLGAKQRTVVTVYLLQAIALGVLGSGAGVLLGMLVQLGLPALVRDFLPLDVAVSVDWSSVLAGLGIGAGAAAMFALLPLLQLRDVTPLRAIRHDFEPRRRARLDVWRAAAYVLIGLGVLQLSLWQAPWEEVGYWFAAALGVTTLVLWLTALGLMYGTRRWFPTGARYVIRQGIANLFRPQNQTVAVILAIGFGVFLIATLYVVQRNLVSQFALDTRSDRPNLALFDIQVDQKDGVLQMLRDRGITSVALTPMVPGRIAKVGERQARRTPGWVMRREFRNTYRDTLVAGEELLAGKWFSSPAVPVSRGSSAAVPQISVEEELASDMEVGVGDRITWDVQGVKIETEIGSIRKVTWARFQPNFFVVFEPGVLESAPQMMVTMTRVEDARARAELTRDLVVKYPNVSAVDLTLVQATLDGILTKVSLAIRFMALFSIASGVIILVGALATSRFQRVREAVLLKTLGASSRQVRQILLTEYFAWGSLAALTGVLLAGAAGWALSRHVFEIPFTLPATQLALVWLGVCALTTVIGFANSGEVLRKTPLAVLREMSE